MDLGNMGGGGRDLITFFTTGRKSYDFMGEKEEDVTENGEAAAAEAINSETDVSEVAFQAVYRPDFNITASHALRWMRWDGWVADWEEWQADSIALFLSLSI